MNYYRDTENGIIYSEAALLVDYVNLRIQGETEAETFTGYLINCLDKNGFLERVEEY